MRRIFTLLFIYLTTIFWLTHPARAQSGNATVNLEQQGTLAFPPLPKIYVDQDGAISINNVVKTKARSAANLKGVWVAAKLMMDAVGFSEKQDALRNIPVGLYPSIDADRNNPSLLSYPYHWYGNNGQNPTVYLAPNRVDSRQNTNNNTFFIWVPLKSTNDLHYTVTSQYEVAKSYLLNYGDSFTQSSTVKTGYTSSNTSVKSISHDQTSYQDYAFGQELSTKMEVSAGGGLFGLIQASVKTTYGAAFTASQKFGFSYTDKYATSFQESYSTQKESTESFTIQRNGPTTPGFVKAYVDLYPTSDYAFTGSDDQTPVDIAPYIDFDGKNFTSIANFIEYIFEPKQFYSEVSGARTPRMWPTPLGDLGYQPDQRLGNLYRYLHAYQDVITMNDGITTNLYSKLKSTFDGKYLPYTTRVWTYSIEQPSIHLNYSARTLSIEQPIDCTPLTKAPSKQINGDMSISYAWDAPVSATKFKLEIKKKGDSWTPGQIYTYLVDRKYDERTHNPMEPTFNDNRTPYDVTSTYVARVTSACGVNGEWLIPSPEAEFTFAFPDCQVQKSSIKAIRDINNEYRLTWAPIPGSQGYYIEYAIENEDFAEARRRLSTTGYNTIHPFDQLQVDTTYPLRADNYFKVKITPKCNGAKGTAIVQYFNVDGSIRTDSPKTNNINSLSVFPNPATEGTTIQFVLSNLKQKTNSPKVSIFSITKAAQVYKFDLESIDIGQKIEIDKPLEPGYYTLQLILSDTQEVLSSNFFVINK